MHRIRDHVGFDIALLLFELVEFARRAPLAGMRSTSKEARTGCDFGGSLDANAGLRILPPNVASSYGSSKFEEIRRNYDALHLYRNRRILGTD
jgi:hypothetical protein